MERFRVWNLTVLPVWQLRVRFRQCRLRPVWPGPARGLLFAILFALSGLLFTPAVERFLSPVPESLLGRRVTAAGYVILAVLVAVGLFSTVAAINTIL